MPRNLAYLLLILVAGQNTIARAEPSAADTLLAQGVREIVFAERSFGPDRSADDILKKERHVIDIMEEITTELEVRA